MSEPNVTPMVDVMLVLLIVFMVAAPLLTAGVAVDLPQTESSLLPGQDEPLSVTVGRDGKVYLQESEIAVDQLGPRLQAVTQRNREARIFVRGDQAVNYGQVMTVMGAIHAAGFTKVALLTQVPEVTAAAPPGRNGT
jgi:biopolymer transport protein TolR